MEYKLLKDVSDKQITECINKAFSDYAIPINLTEATLHKFLESSGVNSSLSFCVCAEKDIIGFILNSSGEYNGEKVAFDAGTGVVPECRGQGIFTSLYRYAENELRKHGIKRYYLEVLQQNVRAVSLYERNGFAIVRNFSVMQLTGTNDNSKCSNIETVPFAEFDYEIIRGYKTVQPSYEHSENVIKACPHMYEVAIKRSGKEISAFCIFDKTNGNIIQLAYADLDELKSVIIFISSKYKTIIAKNIDVECTDVIEMLKSIGFKGIVRQYEMMKCI